MVKKFCASLAILGLFLALGNTSAAVYAEEIEQNEGVMLINETGEEAVFLEETESDDLETEESTDNSSTGRGKNDDDGDLTGAATDREGHVICSDGTVADSVDNCDDYDRLYVDPPYEPEPQIWPAIVSAAAIGITLLVIIILNIRK